MFKSFLPLTVVTAILEYVHCLPDCSQTVAVRTDYVFDRAFACQSCPLPIHVNNAKSVVNIAVGLTLVT